MGRQAVELFHQIPKAMIPERNEATYVAVLNACSHSNLVDQAEQIFAEAKDRSEKMTTAMVGIVSHRILSR